LAAICNLWFFAGKGFDAKIFSFLGVIDTNLKKNLKYCVIGLYNEVYLPNGIQKASNVLSRVNECEERQTTLPTNV